MTELTQSASERVTRVLYIAIGASSIVFGGLSLDPFLAQLEAPTVVASVAAWLLLFGLPMALAVLSRSTPLRVLRVISLAEAAIFFVVLGLWVVFWGDPLPAGADIPWVVTFTAIPAVALATVTSHRVVWCFTIAVSAMSGQLRALTSAHPDPHATLVGAEDGLYTLLFVSIFVGLTLVTRRTAARLDAAEEASRDNFAGHAARVARKQERLTIDALVHDSVISTLLMAGRGGVGTGVVSEHAAKTLRQLDDLRAPAPESVIAGSELLRRLADLTAELAPDAELRANLHDDLEVPTVAVDALLGAVGEALRNSVAAAGTGHQRPVVRTVVVRASRRGIRVVVHDDGVGFDPRQVPAERLGIAQSIIGRMERITGGAAAVRSRPGDGTEVMVSWTP